MATSAKETLFVYTYLKFLIENDYHFHLESCIINPEYLGGGPGFVANLLPEKPTPATPPTTVSILHQIKRPAHYVDPERGGRQLGNPVIR
jgi:hypothetical protein